MANRIILDVLDPTSTSIEGLTATLLLTSPNDSSIRITSEATSDSRSGGLVFEITERLVLKYEYTATVTVTRQTVDTTTYLDSALRKTTRLTDAGDGVNWNDVNLGSWSVPVVENTISIATRKVDVQTAYDAYLTAKEAYEAALASAQSIELEQLETYEPASPTYITTRMLEFQEGTLKAAIRYATDAKLDNDLAYFTRINDLITVYASSLYPNITINDGEGIPYSV